MQDIFFCILEEDASIILSMLVARKSIGFTPIFEFSRDDCTMLIFIFFQLGSLLRAN